MLSGRRAFVEEGVPNVGLMPREPSRGKQLNAAMRLASVGIELAVSTVVGLLAGGWLDKKLGTAPYLMIVGLLIGVVAGFRSLIATARRSLAQADKQTKSDTKSDDV